jgi:hypothetical protein
MHEKLKSWLADDRIFTALLLCLVAITAFLLGRSSVTGGFFNQHSVGNPSVQLLSATVVTAPALPLATSTNSTVTTTRTVDSAAAPYVASKSGTKYHLVTCGSAKQIKVENRLYFMTEEEAKAAGYTKAANCPGL